MWSTLLLVLACFFAVFFLNIEWVLSRFFVNVGFLDLAVFYASTKQECLLPMKCVSVLLRFFCISCFGCVFVLLLLLHESLAAGLCLVWMRLSQLVVSVCELAAMCFLRRSSVFFRPLFAYYRCISML